jgi:hypothetical protein
VLVAGSATAAAPAAPDHFHRGAAGVGDPIFPKAGNGGYDVDHYDLRLDYRPRHNQLAARARIEATATEDLSGFDLDYRGPPISSVEVNGSRSRAGSRRSPTGDWLAAATVPGRRSGPGGNASP